MNDGNPIAGPDAGAYLAGEMASAEVLVIADITAPTELAAIAGAVNGDQRRAYQAAAGSDEYTLYRWDSADSGSASSPYRVAGSSGMWRAVGGRYQDGARFFNGAVTIIGALAASGDFAIATNKFTVASASGNTVVAGTLGVTGTASFSSDLRINSTSPQTWWNETDASSNAKKWAIVVNADVWKLRALDDAEATANDIISITRSGATPSVLTITPALTVTGASTLTGVASTITTLKVGTQDAANSYLGIARNSASDKYAYINAGIGGDGVTQASTGLKLASRNSSNSQIVGLALDENGAATFISTLVVTGLTTNSAATKWTGGSFSVSSGQGIAMATSASGLILAGSGTSTDVGLYNPSGQAFVECVHGGVRVLIAGASDDGANALQVNGTVAGTKDGSVASLLGGLVARNASNTSKNIIIGVTTADIYFIQANLNGTGSRPLCLQPGGGNTLIATSTDDGANKLQVAGRGAFDSGNGVESIVSIGNASGSWGTVRFMNGSTHSAWMTSAQNNVSEAYEITPSTAVGGTTFTTPVFLAFANGSIVLGPRAALATNATDGFVYMPTCAGTPTGVPTTVTGKVARVYDTTNNKIYVYNGGWKATAALT